MKNEKKEVFNLISDCKTMFVQRFFSCEKCWVKFLDIFDLKCSFSALHKNDYLGVSPVELWKKDFLREVSPSLTIFFKIIILAGMSSE